MKNKTILVILVIGIIISTLLLSGCTKNCSVCNGSGKCSWCDGSGYTIPLIQQCEKCDGTGVCPNCGGRGEISAVPGFEGIYLLFALIILTRFLVFKKQLKT